MPTSEEMRIALAKAQGIREVEPPMQDLMLESSGGQWLRLGNPIRLPDPENDPADFAALLCWFVRKNPPIDFCSDGIMVQQTWTVWKTLYKDKTDVGIRRALVEAAFAWITAQEDGEEGTKGE